MCTSEITAFSGVRSQAASVRTVSVMRVAVCCAWRARVYRAQLFGRRAEMRAHELLETFVRQLGAVELDEAYASTHIIGHVDRSP